MTMFKQHVWKQCNMPLAIHYERDNGHTYIQKYSPTLRFRYCLVELASETLAQSAHDKLQNV